MKLIKKLLYAGLCLPGLIHAATTIHDADRLAVTPSLSLHDVVEITRQRNPKIDVIKARLAHADAQLKSTDSLWSSDPSFSINNYNDVIMSNNGLQEWEAGVEMPIWLPGQKTARQKTAQMELQAVNASASVLELELAGVVRELLWSIALSQNHVSLAEQEWKTVQQLAHDVEKRVKLGDLAQSDLILAKQESLSKEAVFHQAQQEFLLAQHRYDLITGLVEIPANFSETATTELSIDDEHPALQEARDKVANQNALRDQVKIEKRGNPSLFVGTRHERGTSNEDFTNAISLSFTMPFGTSAYTTPKITAAEVSLSEARSDMELLYRDLNIALQDADRELHVAQEQYEFAKRNNDLAQRYLELSRKAFALGETSLIELIRIQAQAFASERNLHQRQLEIGLRTARLNQAKGIIP